MYNTVIFDLDGTLLDTLGDLHASVNFALREYSFPERSIDEIRRFIGNGVVRLMERSVPDGTDKETEKKCLNTFREHYLSHMHDRTAPYEGVTDLLYQLRAAGVRTAVVSNKLHSAVVELCEEFFPGLLDVALGVSDESERKPAPVNVFRAIELLKSEKMYTIYIGDSEVDVQTAKNAGLPCIGVNWGFRSEDELISAGAEYIACTPDEVRKLVLT